MIEEEGNQKVHNTTVTRGPLFLKNGIEDVIGASQAVKKANEKKRPH